MSGHLAHRREAWRAARLPALLALLILAAALPLPAAAGAGKTFTAPEALAAAQSGAVTLIDIRRPSEWRETGLPVEALGVTMHDPRGPQGFLDAVLTAVDGDRSKPIALICARGVRTKWAQRFLRANGFETVVDVSEGMAGRGAAPGWLKRGLPTRACAAC